MESDDKLTIQYYFYLIAFTRHATVLQLRYLDWPLVVSVHLLGFTTVFTHQLTHQTIILHYLLIMTIMHALG